MSNQRRGSANGGAPPHGASPSKRALRQAAREAKREKEMGLVVSPTNLTPAGFPGSLTGEQERKLAAFRARLLKIGVLEAGDPMFDSDHELCRFMRARSWDVAKATTQFKDAVRWRADFGADSIIEGFEFEEFDRVVQIYPQFNYNCDKGGRPVYIERLGLLDVPALFKTTTADRMLKFHVREWELMIRIKFAMASRMVGKPVNQTFTVLDLKGCNMSMVGSTVRAFIKTISKVDQDNYPEHLGKMFIVNAPWAFKAVWTVVKPWLDKGTRVKIDICSDNGRKKLLQWVDADKLPDFLGGTCKPPPGGWGSTDTGPWEEKMDEMKGLLAEAKRTGDQGPVRAFLAEFAGPAGEWRRAAAPAAAAAAQASPPEEPAAAAPEEPQQRRQRQQGNGWAAAAGGSPLPDLAALSLAAARPAARTPPRSKVELIDGEEFHDALDFFASPAYH